MDSDISKTSIKLLIAIGIAVISYLTTPLVVEFFSLVISLVYPWVSGVLRILPVIAVTALVYLFTWNRLIPDRPSESSNTIWDWLFAIKLIIAIPIAIIGYLIIPLVMKLGSLIVSWLYPWVSGAEGFFTVLLYAALVYLYYQQASRYSQQTSILARQMKNQNQQTDILKRQAKWMKAGEIPWLIVDDWGVIDNKELYFELKNMGNSPWENPRVIIHAIPLGWAEEDEAIVNPPPDLTPQTPLVDRGDQDVIGPGNNDITKYFADILVSYPDPDETAEAGMFAIYNKSSFRKFLREINEFGAEMIRMWITLVYKDINGDDHTIHLTTVDFNHGRVRKFEDIFDEGEIIQGSIRGNPRSPHPPE